MLSNCGTCGSDRLVKVELARTLMNCVIAWRWGQDWSADNVRSVEGGNFKLWIEEHGQFEYSHWRPRSLQKESIQSTEDIDPIHPNPIQ